MKIITYTLIGIIKLYKLVISPLFPNSCKFEPTCSSYCIESLKTYGVIKGIYTKKIIKNISEIMVIGLIGVYISFNVAKYVKSNILNN